MCVRVDVCARAQKDLFWYAEGCLLCSAAVVHMSNQKTEAWRSEFDVDFSDKHGGDPVFNMSSTKRGVYLI